MQRWNSTGALFLGPKAENGNLFKSLAMEAFENHFKFRESFFPSDPAFVTDEMRQTQTFQDTVEKTRHELQKMHKELENSVPFFSPRYKGHVNWDTLMPANLAYMSAMMYNQNNCAREGSPVTSKYEIEVGRDLCSMIGYDVDQSMGHIVAGGSVANVEGVWAARNLKFYPLGLCDAIKNEDALAKARSIKVFLPQRNKEEDMLMVSKWELLNLDVDEIVKLPAKVAQTCGFPPSLLSSLLNDYMYDSIGSYDFYQRHKLTRSPCCLGTSSAHISLSKGNTILGLGKKHLLRVPVDENARMDPRALRDLLEDKLAKQIPVISVVCIMGTTEESAVDPLTDILTIRREMRQRGLNFAIHADGAWGGYFCSMLRLPSSSTGPDEDASWHVPTLPLSTYTQAQLSALQHADTVTIDPHKSGFCPYPGGAICYRDKRINGFLAVNSAVNYYHGDIMLGNVGIEGSKPGAAAAGIVMAHRVVGLHQNGYGQLLGECMFTSKILYCMWVCLPTSKDPFFIAPTKPLPPDRTREEHIKFMRRHIIGKKNAEIAKNKEAMDYLREIGPDTLVPCFTFNIKGNSDVNLLNKMVDVIMEDLCPSREKDGESSRLPMVITSSTYRHDPKSSALSKLKRRLELDPEDTTGVRYIITSCMDPQVAGTGELLSELAPIMRNAILNAIGTITERKNHHDFIATGLLNNENHPRQVITYYASQFANSSAQYCAVAKFEFCRDEDASIFSAMCCDTEPVVLRTVMCHSLRDLLFDNGRETAEGESKSSFEVDCYIGHPVEGKTPFLRVPVRVVDVPRFEKLEPSVAKYPDTSKYFLYGHDDKAYIMHIPTKQPDFLQLIELAGVPDDITPVLLQHGIDLYLHLRGCPKMKQGRLVDPLERLEYVVNYKGQNGHPRRTIIRIGKKLWFDSRTINNAGRKMSQPVLMRSLSQEERCLSLQQLTRVGMRRRLLSMSECQ